MTTSKLTAKARTTIPQSVRATLHLTAGDDLAYEIVGDKVVLTKGPKPRAEDPYGAFTEWDSEADRKAYSGL